MARREKLSAARDIRDIRIAQSAAAAGRALAERRAHERLDAALTAEREQLVLLQDGWARTVARADADPALWAAWAEAMLEGDAAVAQADLAVKDASAQRREMEMLSRLSEACSQAARDVAQALDREMRAARETAAQDAAEDRFVMRWRKP